MTRLVQGNETITKDNVKMLGEYIAIVCAKRSFSYFPSKSMDKIFAGLCDSVFNPKESGQIIDQGYDMASEAICFLCQHFGKSLSDTTTVTKYGVPKEMSIYQACYFTVTQYIRQYIVKSFYIKDINDPNIQLEIGTYEISYFEEDPEESWQSVDEVIAKLNLSDDMKETLNCFLSGYGYSKTARILSCAVSTAFHRREILQRKYLSID